MSKPFRERNPVIIGAISLAVIALLILAAFRAQDLPLIGGGDTYYGGVHRGRRPQGQRRGPDRRRPGRQGRERRARRRPRQGTFRVKTDSEFGDETGAAIKVKTLLGAMYLALEPAGPGQLEEGRRSRSSAPARRTTSSRRSPVWPRPPSEIDTDQLARVADDAGRPDPQHARGVPGAR